MYEPADHPYEPFKPRDEEELRKLVRLVREEWIPKVGKRDRYLRIANIVVATSVSLIGLWFAWDKYAQSKPNLEVSVSNIDLSYDLTALDQVRQGYDEHPHKAMLGKEHANELDNAFIALRSELNEEFVSGPWSLRERLVELCELAKRLQGILRAHKSKARVDFRKQPDDHRLQLEFPWGVLSADETDIALDLLEVADDDRDSGTAILSRWELGADEYATYLEDLRAAADPQAFHVEANVGVSNTHEALSYLVEPSWLELGEKVTVELTVTRDYADGGVSRGGAIVEGRTAARLSLRSVRMLDEQTRESLMGALKARSEVRVILQDVRHTRWKATGKLGTSDDS